MKGKRVLLCLFLGLTTIGMANNNFDYSKRKDATQFTVEKNKIQTQDLNFSDQEDFKDAKKGFIAGWPENKITDSKGNVVWDFEQWKFLGEPGKTPAPESVNPSLWRQAQLNTINGLFEVVPGVYQVRGFDLSNITFVRGKTGWIVIDTCTSKEVAEASYELVRKNLEDLPIKAVIFTHSHADHFGGAKGIASQEKVDKGEVMAVAPSGFFKESISENLMAGNAMSRRASYMYGSILPKDDKGTVDAGLGKAVSVGDVTILNPSDVVDHTGEKLVIDGLDFEFIMANGTEAPSEFMFYIPEYKALCVAEVVNGTLHNLSTLRGAKTRDALKWAKSIDEAKALYGDKAQVMFGPHHWPTWGQENVDTVLEKHRDAYKFIHDQTLRLANQGYNPVEIAEKIELPESLNKEFYNRGYYGTVNHGAKAVYDFYFGAWWDGNPVNLYKLPPVEAGKNYVNYMGGEENVIKMAKESYKQGDYRWVAEVMNHVVAVNPNNQEARNLEADALEQLGYQSESATWRAYFLTGAQELRNGVKPLPVPNTASPDIIRSLPIQDFLDYLAVRVNPQKAEGLDITMNIEFTDLNENYSMELKNSVLNSSKGLNKNPDSTIKITRATFNKILSGNSIESLIKNKEISISNIDSANKLFGTLDNFKFWFNIITPNGNN